jgi:hypothetical protein
MHRWVLEGPFATLETIASDRTLKSLLLLHASYAGIAKKAALSHHK